MNIKFAEWIYTIKFCFGDMKSPILAVGLVTGIFLLCAYNTGISIELNSLVVFGS